jgi:acyl-[acyl-carrier-protein]-phospholipid O-acyltransferase/long-chain-fatty-acid--[acyl-carrier-protein] ligase
MISQTIGAFNDNAMKAMLPLMAAVQFGKASMDTVNQQVSILLIVPFVLFAPIAGWVTDRFSKKKVIVTALLGQLLGLGVLGIALYWQSLEFSLAGFFILSVQSAFFLPSEKRNPQRADRDTETGQSRRVYGNAGDGGYTGRCLCWSCSF